MDKPKSRSEAVEDPKEEERVETPIASRAKKTIYILINIFKKFQCILKTSFVCLI